MNELRPSDPIELLRQEHRVLSTLLDCLHAVMLELREHRRLEFGTANELVDLLDEFGEQLHHGKEERLLFGFVAAYGLPREAGALSVMAEEHDLGRLAFSRMREALAAASSGAPRALPAFQRAAEDYLAMPRSHMLKEDRVVFPLVDTLLTPDTREKLRFAMERADSFLPADTFERVSHQAEAIAERLHLSTALLRSDSLQRPA
jgi:hemerythrin-like domain-containing protein